jgi:CheY-like chemotaxis protein
VLKKKILIIDDEVKVANVIKRLLEATGKYDARIETDGERAVSAVRT